MTEQKLTVAKCLKLKNRLVGRMSNVEDDIRLYNSVLEEQKGQVDVLSQMKLRSEIAECLVVLKTAIMKANLEIQHDLISLGEMKASLSFIKEIPVRDGKERHGYQNTEVVYTATLKKKDIDNTSRELEGAIDKLQDKIDQYNHQTFIAISQRTLDLAS